MLKTSIIILVSGLIISTLAYGKFRIVKMPEGRIRGGVGVTENKRPYYYFTGIPYAKPPVGQLRFELPVAAEAWRGTLNATGPHNVCLQFASKRETDRIVGSEDCLYLNIYTPKLSKKKSDLLPVMFFLEGEDFAYSNPNKIKYGPEYLLNKDVVLVTVGYRLGPLGFFLTAGTAVRGNMGLKDQAFALKWVNEHIHHFGGNPKRITLFGSGSGSASVHYHMISPLSKDFVNGVITQSGTAFNSWALTPIQVVGINCKIISGFAGCTASVTVQEMVKCLRGVDAKTILNATSQLSDYGISEVFKPVLEFPPQPGAFVVTDPIRSVRAGQVANVPIMMGIATGGGVIQATNLLKDPNTLQKWRTNFNEMASQALHYKDTAIVAEKPVISSHIKEFYFNETEIGIASKDNIINMFTDGLFLEGLRSSLDLHMKYHKQPIYNYLFGYRGSESFINRTNNEVTFKDELLYLFKNDLDFPNYIPTKADLEVTHLLIDLWTNFATYGDPTPNESSAKKWLPVHKGEEYYYYIQSATDIELKKGLFPDRAQFWRSLGLDSRRKDIRDNL
ncbi:venom carboxylesterase-6-like isoform X2 [Photinus pyralis]|uniref:venom carboxylesterase-6-like isoform X2 n=1 Tax=Photinus pyralis TaxID=7054 RepID=UPI00126756AE|nr:venom carboxylesterase-6-like isoform X2 [Photinus pyralis]